MTKTHGYTIFLDMDGVISDFARKVAELMGIFPKEALDLMEKVDEATIDKRKMWKAINSYDAHTPFFYSLEKMHDADILFDFVKETFAAGDIGFLTASGHSPQDAPHQKKRWIRKHYGKYHTEVVTKSLEKAAFAGPKVILVDDRSKSIDPWVEAGGIGILHTDAKSTIQKIKDIIEKGA
jgi:hypothetical protein